jgi:DNA-binding XRE family transcriptional regulator
MTTITDAAGRERADIQRSLDRARRNVRKYEAQFAEWNRRNPRYDACQVGARVRQTRVEMNLSQAMLARIAGMGRRTLSAIERGENSPSVTTIYRLCAATGLSPSWIIGGDAKRWLTSEERLRAVELAATDES